MMVEHMTWETTIMLVLERISWNGPIITMMT